MIVICSDGSCLLSCGPTKEDRKSDLLDVLSNTPCDNKIASDIYFCEDKQAANCSKSEKPDNYQGKKDFQKLRLNYVLLDLLLRAELPWAELLRHELMR